MSLTSPQRRVPIFDLDGTLLDSDQALLDPLLAAGVSPEDVVFGEPLAAACTRLGVDMDWYLRTYDVTSARPFDGVEELIAALDRWGIASNKYGVGARPELERLGWQPDIVLFSEDFEHGPKRLDVVLEGLGLRPEEAVFVGDTEGDRACARNAGVEFVLAGWNPRASPAPGDLVLSEPAELLDVLR